MAPLDFPSRARVDPAAARLALARLARAREAPWLHQEAARRMGERLGWIKRRPAVVLDWSDAAGASTAVLAAEYPKARHVRVRDASDDAQPDTPWWRRWVGSAGPRDVPASALQPGEAELIWSN